MGRRSKKKKHGEDPVDSDGNFMLSGTPENVANWVCDVLGVCGLQFEDGPNMLFASGNGQEYEVFRRYASPWVCVERNGCRVFLKFREGQWLLDVIVLGFSGKSCVSTLIPVGVQPDVVSLADRHNLRVHRVPAGLLAELSSGVEIHTVNNTAYITWSNDIWLNTLTP